ncbi:Uncharacterized protein DBV15_06981 [Temnothorax longispinosus]|uniref:Uncharacterized protein n=1 Tax=Temnothorax longispinosus TaxID=300112 RepID=A0A4S2KV67_9HYME|nr:Uncharacterized protein DBV15_06981 [Temnothorax longispinosus]
MIKDGGRYEVHRHRYKRRPRRQPYEMRSLEPPCRAASDECANTEISRERREVARLYDIYPYRSSLKSLSQICSKISRISNRDFVSFGEEFDERSSLSRAHER